ncbi:MAG: hypothetical protein QF898_04210 [SAR202 cluster bacterium]|jgi:hypothetical protein|nr:hypothetical protein [SAR202 cluster bacterium]MDP6714625.1 hypothetical protein [SAR202 cluster bacterium]
MTTITATANNAAVNEKVSVESKVSSFFSTIAYAVESYIGPMSLDIASKEHRSKLSRENNANVDATLNGVGIF